MYQIFLYILLSICYSANIVSPHYSAIEQVDLAEICTEQVTVKQILSTIANILKSLKTSTKRMNN